MNTNDLLKEVNLIKDELIEMRHHLHSNPEVGFEIDKTYQFVFNKLKEYGLSPIACGKKGIVATVGGKKEGQTFLLRADMDALPICEQTDVSFKSQNDFMHACGHDMHTTMLLGAAKILKNHEYEIEGTIKLMFQPAEEIFEGSKNMIENGLLENPKVDAALMIHVMAGLPLDNGSVIVSNPGVSAPAADYFTIKVKGKGAHGSMPNLGIDPINAASHIVVSLQEIHARELAMSDAAVLTIGQIHGGRANNAICDEVDMGGSIRTYDEKVRSFIKERLEAITKGIASSFRCEANVEYGSGCPTLVNDETLAKDAYEAVLELLGPTHAFTVAQFQSGNSAASKSTGSEDFAYVSHQVPSIMLAMSAGNSNKGYLYGQHHPSVKFDDEALTYGASVYAYCALHYLNNHKKS